jgi:hypothetical protein
MYGSRMFRRIAIVLAAALLLGAVVMSCTQTKQPSVAPGHHLCTYCCTTANTECSCELVDAVECPAPNDTARLAACAECRACTRRVDPGATCDRL